MKAVYIGLTVEQITQLQFASAEGILLPQLLNTSLTIVSQFDPDVIVLHRDAFSALQTPLEVVSESSHPIASRGLGTNVSKRIQSYRNLTTRQKEMLSLLHGGLQNKEIAQLLRLSLRTVKNEMAHLFLIFDVSNRTELLASAMDLGII